MSDKTYQKVVSKCQTRSTPFPGGVGTTLGNGSKLCWEVEFYLQLHVECMLRIKLSKAEVYREASS